MVNTAIAILVHITFLLTIGMIVAVARKSQKSQLKSAFLFTLSAMSVWNAGTVLEIDFSLRTGLEYPLLNGICYIGICIVPVAILYLGKVIQKPDFQLRPVYALLFVVPAASILMVFTNPLHNLFFINFSLNSTEAVYGAYFYIHSLYSYSCIAVGVALMLVASVRNYGVFSVQSVLVVTATFITLIPNVLYSFGVMDLPFSISTIAFTFSLIILIIAFWKFRFIKTLPITLKQIVDLISDGYLVVDKDLCVLTHNKALLNLFNEPGGAITGANIRPLVESYFSRESFDKFMEMQALAAERRETVSMEARINGGVYVNVEITPVMQHNSHTGSIILLKDITESKLLIESSQAASRAKSDFLSYVSHEIRTPLNAIIGMINIGLESGDTAKKNYCFARADSASKHLLGIINDVLDISKIEADKFELGYREFDFEKILMSITNVANVRAEEKQLNFVVDLSSNVPAYLGGDELRLSQVITNLLTNAIKFTPEKGTVILRIEKISEEGEDVALQVEVSDTGPGIPEEQQERLFAPFSQADANVTRKFGGTGLGLVISKRIVELMGGDIWMESEYGEGSKFIFTVKLKKLSGKPRAKLVANIKKEDIQILAVDDSAEARNFFAGVMESLALPCDLAESGDEAMAKIKSMWKKPYNIFFVDWQMPDIDGIELTKKIRETSGDNSIVIMTSGNDWSAIEKEALAAGVNYFIPKPLFPSSLINAINICIGMGPEGPVSEMVKTPKIHYDFYKHTILLAEDIDINREIISAVLEETQVTIDFAEDGRKALDMFEAAPDRYSLILMDINMPEMDGYEATKRIRALDIPWAKDIPILAMTANVFREDVEKCLASGMNDHTGKPVDSNALLGMMNKYLSNLGKTGVMNNVYNLRQGVAWDESLITGNAHVDMQHQRVFEKVALLVEACEDGSGCENLQDTMEFLINYTVRHFTDEEALMLEHRFPGIESHRKAHEGFKVTVNCFAQEFRERGPSAELAKDVHKVIIRWLVNHIKQEDKKFCAYIKEKSP